MPKLDATSIGRPPALVFISQVFTGGLLGLLVVGITVGTIVGLGLNYGAKANAFSSALIIASGSFLGYVLGGILLQVLENKIKAGNRTVALAKIDSGHELIISSFLSVTIIITCLYVLFYFLAMMSMSAHIRRGSGLPLDFKVLIISAATVGAFGYFSVRYAAYVKMTKRLENALKQAPKDRNRDLIEVLREAVFRGEHLYEPAGNIFVTVGITATFVGLAVALVILDLPSLLGQADGNTAAQVAVGIDQTGLSPDQLEEQRRAQAMASMTSFVGCMGLALGMSMVGVMTAMAAQWLRGLGASKSTEDLITEADAFLEAKPPARKRAAPPAPSPSQTTSRREPSPVPPLRGSAPGPAGDGAARGDEPLRGTLSLLRPPPGEGA